MGEAGQAMSGVDLAYRILKEKKTDIYFRDLLGEVLAAKSIPPYLLTQAMAELHTQINMDSRFAFKGQGRWGLTEWVPLTRTSGKNEDVVGAVADEEVQLRRAKLQEVQEQDEPETGFQHDNDEPA